jgi:hypothetical protein
MIYNLVNFDLMNQAEFGLGQRFHANYIVAQKMELYQMRGLDPLKGLKA